MNMKKIYYYGGIVFVVIMAILAISNLVTNFKHENENVTKPIVAEVTTEVEEKPNIVSYRPIYGLHRVEAEYMNLRTQPDLESDIITHMMNGAIIPINKYSDDNKWGFSELYNGWLYLELLSQVPLSEYDKFVICVEDLNTHIKYDNVLLRLYDGNKVKISDDLYVPLKNNWYIHPNNTYTANRGGTREKLSEVSYNDITKPSNLSVKEIHSLIKGTGLEGIELAVKEVEDEYGINALYTISVAAHESGWGTSSLARNRNNLFGIAAYDSNTNSAKYFDNKYDCVKYWGRMIKNNYFDQGLTTTQSINKVYASDQNWSRKVNSIMNECYRSL